MFPMKIIFINWRHKTVYSVRFKYILGNIPEVSDKTVDRTMCRSNLTNTCGEKIDMQIRNCGSFRTYYLQQLNVDKSAYCFGMFYSINLINFVYILDSLVYN